tara:strand:+ start:1212 stop:1775 length:564 start_codon:yes stop_codon:yes gene_type:complete
MKLSILSILAIIGLSVFAESQDRLKANVPADIMTSSLEIDASQIFCLAQNIYFEAGNQSLEGMAAVADVTLNRVQEERYPDTICDVVKSGVKHPNGMMKKHKCQFSWYCDGKSDAIPNMPNNQTWQNAEFVAKAMLLQYNMTDDGDYFGITCGATHYHANYVVPNWIEDRGMNRVKQVGAHIFYKLD